MRDTPDACGRAYATDKPGAVALLIPAVLTIHLASVVFVLYFARVHPVRYFLDMTAARHQSFPAYACAVLAAAVGVSSCTWRRFPAGGDTECPSVLLLAAPCGARGCRPSQRRVGWSSWLTSRESIC